MPTFLVARRALLPDPAAGCTIGPARVGVHGGRVVSVEPGGAAQPGDEDLGDLLLAPAFVDVHTHLALCGLRGVDGTAAGNVVEELYFRVEREMTDDDIYALAAVGAQDCLLHGTGFVSDHYYGGPAVARAMVDTGLSGLVGCTLQDLAGPGAHAADAALAQTDALRQDTRLAAAGVAATLAPHATDTVSDALWRRIARLAEAWQLPVHCHVAQSPEEVARAQARCGDTPLGLLRRLGVLDAGPAWALVHALFTTPADRAALDRQRHLLVACPHSQAWFGFPAPIHRWQADGLRWAVATDCAASNDSMSVNKELRAVGLLRATRVTHGPELTAWESAPGGPAHDRVHAIRLAQREVLPDPERPGLALTRVGAVPGSLHPTTRAGAIEPGRLANFALWDLDHPALWPGVDPLRGLAAGDTNAALARMMVAGRWLSPLGGHAALAWTPAWREARQEANARLRSLLTRAGYPELADRLGPARR